MPAPTTASEFVDLVLKSGVVEESRVREFLKKLAEGSSGIPSDPARLAGLMVHEGLLTYFQAEQILQGKYKRFTIGKYKVLEKLGSGGMGQVFLCEHILMRRRVAIKVLPTTKAQDPAGLERFYREARAIAAVDHPNLVRAYDIDQAENLHFLVMEYVDGVSLQELVKKIGPLPVLRACHYIYGAAVGLNHVHEIGLIHRDIKPSNILVDRHGMVKILDLGLARFFHDTDELTKKYDENILGTADYLSPEQAVDSHTVDIRTDIYSLGATFYYLLTGQPPFPEGTVTQKLIWHQTRDPKPISAYRSDVPPEIIAIIDKMMKKKPEERYQTPAELMQALAPWVTVPIPPPSEQELPALSRAAGGGMRPQVSAGPITPITPSPASAGGDSSSVSTLPSLGPAGVPHPPPPQTPPPSASELYPGVAALPPSVPLSSPPSSGAALTPSAALGTSGLSPSSAETPGVSLVAPVAPAAVWESLSEQLSAETASAIAQPTSTATPLRTSRRTATAASRSPRLIFLAGAGLLLVAAGTAIAWYFLKGSPTPPTAPQGAGSTSGQRTWIVTKAGGEPNTVPSLREALLKAAPGDLILIREAKISEPPLRLDRQRHKNITIRGDLPGDTYPVWEAIVGGRPMLEISGVEGVQLQKLALDGADQATNGVFLSGIIPGVVLEQITCQRCSLAAVRCQNVTGSAEQSVHIRQVRILLNKPEQIGVHLAALNASTQHLQIIDCRFEGNNNSVGIRLEGSSQNVLISEGRFFQLRTAVKLGPVPRMGVCQGTFQRNVVANCAEGLVWDRQVPKAARGVKETPGKNCWPINGNYFFSVREIGKGEGGGGPLEGLQIRDNARAPGCGEGNLGWQIP
ncbi:MAG: protein kinase, partial [Gemmataceae bacterium]|nr:protein kinase [Gemmataceae bacterium]